ncbi:MAG TPA: hypothetical protein VLG76_00625 [Rhabdochlamydiaceae bacterium]|nr:hypothetical protein [Rhabdochlamydiaceae bacterium]
MSSFAFAKTFSPILNTPKFSEIFGGKDGCSLSLDEQGLMRAIETVAFPNTKFKIIQESDTHVLQVETEDYPCTPLFVDKRFLTEKGLERKKEVPSVFKIINSLQNQIGATYIWGGNTTQGIPELLQLYPPKVPLDEKMRALWTLKGVDCSGLLYEATDGTVPRNTSWLIKFGRPLLIENLSYEKIASLIKPLDLILWPGHVIIALDSKTCIESRPQTGVVIQNLTERLYELNRKPLLQWDSSLPTKDHFIIRRWHSSSI